VPPVAGASGSDHGAGRGLRFVVGTALVLAISTVVFLAGTASAQSGGGYDLSWHTIDGGGAMVSTVGDFELGGTVGQPDAGAMAGGDFTLTGGFWFALAPGDCNADGGVNLFDYDAFEACLSGPGGGPLSPECTCFDLDGSGTVDMLDFALLQEGFSGS
jgi:hypothetical protein